jgi:hypothetical protein
MGKLLTGTLLLVLGCVFLLVNFGYISWDVIEGILKLWPLLLVAWGIGLITRNSKLSFLGFLGPLILLFAVAYVVWGYHYVGDGDKETYSLSQELTDVDEANVTIKFAGGRLNVKSGDTVNLIDAELETRADSAEPRLSYYEEDGIAFASLRRRGTTRAGPGMGNKWDVTLTDQIPLQVRLVSEGATSSLDLDGLLIAELDVDAAASRVNARLGAGDMDAEVTIDAGVSSVTLEIPKQYGIRLYVDCGLCWKDLPDGMKKRSGGGGAYYSKNYESAPYRMDVEIDAGLSKVVIEQY